MSDLVINLIGIITLSCGAVTTATPDPCAAHLFPKNIEMIIPDGRFHSKVCKTGNAVDPTVEPHEAFIRIRGARANAPQVWPGAIQCDAKPAPCVLYPVVKRTLTINGVTSGGGTTITNLDDFENLRWSSLFPAGALPKLGSGPRLARMTIANGEITYDEVPGFTDAVGATITVPNPAGPTVIRAQNASGNALELRVPDTATIDILNLPRYTALSEFADLHVHDDCDHFFLHYELAEKPPAKNCPFPDNEHCPPTEPRPAAGGTIACSNSTYP